jgi:hypothetical protein
MHLDWQWVWVYCADEEGNKQGNAWLKTEATCFRTPLMSKRFHPTASYVMKRL